MTVRDPGDLGLVRGWLADPRDGPPVIDTKVASAGGSRWLEEAFPVIDRARPGQAGNWRRAWPRQRGRR